MKMKLYLSAALICFLAAMSFATDASAQAITWAKKMDFYDGVPGGNSGGGNVADISVDALDNTYVTGFAAVPVDFGGGVITTFPGATYPFIAKYDPAGNLVWSRLSQGNGAGQFQEVHAASNGDLYFASNWTGAGNIFGFTLPTLPLLDYGGFIGRMSPTGQMLALTTFSGTDYCEMWDIKEASNGDLFVSGSFAGSLQVGGQTLVSAGTADLFLARLSPTGNVIWTFQATGNFQYYGHSYLDMAVDANDNLIVSTYVVGNSQVGPNNYPSAGSYDVLLMKLDGNGNLQWSQHYGGPGGDLPSGLAVDAAGNIYTCGEFTQSFSIGGTSLSATGNTLQDLWLAKMTPNGTPVWATSGGGMSQDRPYDMAINSNAELFLCGVHAQSATFGSITLQNLNTAANHMVLKYDSSGTILWGAHWGRPGAFGANNGYPVAIALDGQENPIIGGIFEGVYDFNGVQLTQTGQSVDGYIARVLDNANWITGTVYRDFNQNGGIDPGDSGFPGAIVEMTPGPRYFFSGSNGDYTGGTDVGNYSLTVPNPPLYHTVTAPATQTASFATLGNVDSLNHFGLYPTPNVNDLRISITPYHLPRPGDTLYYRLHYYNVGTTTINGTVKFLPDALLSVLQSTPTANNTVLDTLFWNVANLAPQAQGDIIVSCIVPLPPVIALGDTLLLQAWIDPVNGDAAPTDNMVALTQIVVGSFDPNEKVVAPAGDIALSDVTAGMWLDYTIYFQNTGTDTAFQVVVRDTLDANLDVSTLEMIASSHSYHLDLNGAGNLAWHFNPIQLPDSNVNEPASHGFIRFRIRPKTTLQLGQTIRNHVAIYFDFNAPIVTNSTLNTVVTTVAATAATTPQHIARVYPNPSNGHVFIETEAAKASMMTVDLCDLQGRNLKTFSFSMGAGRQVREADCSGISAGIYFLRMTQNGRTSVMKLVIE